jgi:putative transport protein
MGADILSVIRENPALVLFLILGLGLLVGRVRIRGIPLGSVTGVLFFGLMAGHYGLIVPQATLSVGFILFIYAVGVQAGPSFVGSFKQEGKKYIALALLSALTATGAAVAFTRALDLDLGIGAGLLAGALTSTPTLVAAQDAAAQGLSLPAGISADRVLDNISAAYAITYLFGMGGLIMTVGFLPRLLRMDVAQEALRYSMGGALFGRGAGSIEKVSVRAYRVEKPDLVGREFGDRTYEVAAEIQRIKRLGEVFSPSGDTALEPGDIVSLVGPPHVHDQAREKLGPEVIDDDVLDRTMETRSIILTNRAVRGKTVGQMNFASEYECVLTRVIRASLDIPRKPGLTLRLGDVLVLTGSRTNLDALSRSLGHSESTVKETDLVTFAFGIALGLLVGIPSFALGKTSIGLGTAGGVLVVGICIGLFHTYRPDLGRLPHAARHVLMELGLLFFMANIGINAGQGIAETFASVGPALVLAGAAVTLLPAVSCLLVGRYLLKMNGAVLMGAITGAMTSTAALNQVSAQARSSVPLLGYAGTYAIANIVLTFCGALIMRL